MSVASLVAFRRGDRETPLGPRSVLRRRVRTGAELGLRAGAASEQVQAFRARAGRDSSKVRVLGVLKTPSRDAAGCLSESSSRGEAHTKFWSCALELRTRDSVPVTATRRESSRVSRRNYLSIEGRDARRSRRASSSKRPLETTREDASLAFHTRSQLVRAECCALPKVAILCGIRYAFWRYSQARTPIITTTREARSAPASQLTGIRLRIQGAFGV